MAATWTAVMSAVLGPQGSYVCFIWYGLWSRGDAVTCSAPELTSLYTLYLWYLL